MWLVLLVLIWLFLLCDIVKEQSVLDLRDLSIGKLGLLFGIVFNFHEYLMFFSLRVHECPCFFSECFVVVFELLDLVWAADDALELPGGVAVAQVLPFHHVEPVDLHVQVECPHVSKVDVAVGVLQVLLPIILVVLQPTVAELAGTELL